MNEIGLKTTLLQKQMKRSNSEQVLQPSQSFLKNFSRKATLLTPGMHAVIEEESENPHVMEMNNRSFRSPLDVSLHRMQRQQTEIDRAGSGLKPPQSL